ncbi:MAG TPA: TetR/AcrR family transcriptional regulator [Micromonosporaceae bacterium]
MSPPPAKRRRVPALAPEQRRAALIEATLPLLKQYGAKVSTRQIALAAGVAEGTIFGVFPDKAALLRATVVRALDPEETIAAIGSIDRSLDLRTRLEQATAILVDRTAENVELMTTLFRSGLFDPPPDEPCRTQPGPPPQVREARERIIDAVVSLIGPDASQLRHSPGVTVGLLVSMVFVAGHGGFGFTWPVASPAEIVSLLLDGLLKPHPLPTGVTLSGGTAC